MRRLVLALTTCVFILTLSGCEKAQQAVNVVDKEKNLSEDLQKKTLNKLYDSFPRFSKKSSKGEEKESGHKEEKDKDD